MEIAFDLLQGRRLGEAFRRQAEALRGKTQHVVAFDLGRHDLDRRQPQRVDRLHQMPHQRRLASANVAGDDDETFTLRQAIAQIGQRLAMGGALEIIMRVRRQLERAALQSIKLFVHIFVSTRSR
jgi:hypothetical protein